VCPGDDGRPAASAAHNRFLFFAFAASPLYNKKGKSMRKQSSVSIPRKKSGMASHPEQRLDPIPAEPPMKRLLRAVRRRWLGGAGSRLPLNDQEKATGYTDLSPSIQDKRRQPRIALKDTSVRVTDGCLCATARLDNISPNGICLSDLPEQLYRSAGRLTVFSSDNPGLPVLHIEPRWQQTGWGGKTIGAAILNVSETWQLFFVHAASRIEA
jgi:hypothetical protein